MKFITIAILCCISFLGLSQTSRQIIENAGIYSSTQKYNQSDVVSFSNIYYISLISNNTGNNPAISPIAWNALSSSAGLQDPGSNGIVYRSSLNSTTIATPSQLLQSFGSQSANCFFGGPSSSAGSVSCRTIQTNDLPSISYLSLINTPTLGSASAQSISYFDLAGSAASVSNRIVNVGITSSGLLALYLHNEATGIAPIDYSGQGNNAILPGSSPLYPIGSPYGHSFTGSQYFNMPTAVSSAATTVITYVCGPTITYSSGPYVNAIPTFMSSNTAGGLAFHMSGIIAGGIGSRMAWYPAIGLNTNTTTFRTTFNSSTENASGGCTTLGWAASLSGSGVFDQLYTNSRVIAPSTSGYSGAGIGIGTLQLGGNSSASPYAASAFYGTVRVTAIWNRVLSASEFIANSNAIQTLGNSLGINSASQDSTTGDILIGGVDSITYGQNATTPSTTGYFPLGCASMINSPICLNLGIAGAYMAEFNGQMSNTISSRFRPASRNTLSILGCINDFVTLFRTPAQCYSDIVSTANQAHKLGFKVIIIAILDRTGQSANHDSLNALLSANWSQFADAYLSGTDPNLYADGANANATWFNSTDKTHPTQLGYTTLGSYFANTYNKLYGSTETNYNTNSAATYTIQAADNYLRVTANSALTLPNCAGYTGSWHIMVNTGLTVTISNAVSSQTINGINYSVVPLALVTGKQSVFISVPSAPATATCTWQQN